MGQILYTNMNKYIDESKRDLNKNKYFEIITRVLRIIRGTTSVNKIQPAIKQTV